MRSRALGERESGTARLEEAVAAFREALEECTRERVPLDWAMTQNNLGVALSMPRRARERHGAARRGGRCLSCGAEGTNPRARAARMGHDPEQSGHRARGPRRARERHDAARTRRSRPFARRLLGTNPRARAVLARANAAKPERCDSPTGSAKERGPVLRTAIPENRHCERSEAIHPAAQRRKKEWIASLRSQ